MCGRTHRLEHESPEPAPNHAAQGLIDQRIWHIKPDLRFDGVSRSFSDCIKSIDKCCIDAGFGGQDSNFLISVVCEDASRQGRNHSTSHLKTSMISRTPGPVDRCGKDPNVRWKSALFDICK